MCSVALRIGLCAGRFHESPKNTASKTPSSQSWGVNVAAPRVRAKGKLCESDGNSLSGPEDCRVQLSPADTDLGHIIMLFVLIPRQGSDVIVYYAALRRGGRSTHNRCLHYKDRRTRRAVRRGLRHTLHRSLTKVHRTDGRCSVRA